MFTYYLMYLVIASYTTFADDYSKEIEVMDKLICPPSPSSCQYSKKRFSTYIAEYAKYFTVNGKLLGVYEEGQGLVIVCSDGDIAIDNPSFPKFETNVFMQKLEILDCIAPQMPYANAIKKLNISFESLVISFSTFDERFNFTNIHFTGLHFLKEFQFYIISNFLKDYFHLEPLLSLPPKISLILSQLVLAPFPPGTKFENVFVEYGRPRNTSQSWGSCNYLRNLTIQHYNVNVLPEGWLSNCTRLEELRIDYLGDVVELPRGMLENANALRTLTITNSKIITIPNDFFTFADNLKSLNLSHNQIDYYGRKDVLTPFSSLNNLEILDLTEIFLEAKHLEILGPLTSLRNLSLEMNSLAGICRDSLKPKTGENTTTWPYLPSLVYLSLKHTLVAKPCPEWHEAMPSLKYIDMRWSSTKYSLNFTFADLKLISESGWNIDARDNTIDIIYNETDYNNVLSEESSMDLHNQSTLLLTSPVECNCEWYWFIKTMKERPNHIKLPEFSCAQDWGGSEPKLLVDVDPDGIMCDLEEGCPTECDCFQLAHSGAVLVNCTDKRLDKVPIFEKLKELVMPNNHLSVLQSEDLPDSMEYIDLRNNLLAIIKPDLAQTLFSVQSRKMQLSGNPFLCNCENREFLELLNIHKQRVLDFKNVTCIEGSQNVLLENVDLQNLCTRDMMNIALISLSSLVIFGILTCGIYYFNRNKINKFLNKHGFNFGLEDTDIHKIHDAFISFAHEDSWFVSDELMPILEEENGFKLCVHTRDWMVGDWIPAQIAKSVQDSRRTIIVLSKNFLSSIWALLEFRTAHMQALRDKRIRVIIILLEDLSSEVRMDDEMKKYLTTNTYVKWGEQNFWEKLRKALEYRTNERQIMKAGEELAKMYRRNDPAIPLQAMCDVNPQDAETEP